MDLSGWGGACSPWPNKTEACGLARALGRSCRPLPGCFEPVRQAGLRRLDKTRRLQERNEALETVNMLALKNSSC